MKNVLDPHLLQKAREAALYKVKNSLPMGSETPDAHVSRCWAEAFIDVGLLHVTPEVRTTSAIKAFGDVVGGYERRIESVKKQAQTLAKETANSLTKIEIDCPRDTVNPGLYFGFMMGVSAALEILEDWG